MMAIAGNLLAGTAHLTVDAKNYMVVGDMSYSVSAVERTTLKGQSGVHGFSESISPGFIAMTLRDAGGLSVQFFNGMVNVTVVVELANGKTIIGRNMWTVGVQEVKTAEATFDVRFESATVEEA
jgi:Phage tail tube protein